MVGKRSHKVCEIQKQHTSAVDMKDKNNTNIQPLENSQNSWKIKSRSHEEWYVVEKVNSICTTACNLYCQECKIFIHMYTCTCIDAMMHHTICKHVHLLCLLGIDHESIGNSLPVDFPHAQQTAVATCISSGGPGSVLPSSFANVSKENVLQKIDQLRDLVSKSYGCNLHEVSSHLSSSIAD